MDGPKISIVTPSYNQVEFIERNLESVYSQDYANVEHIVVDGGSDDGTVSLLKEYESRYDLRWVSEPDRGQTHALNKGIGMATGEWIGWQNSDDFYLPGAFETVARTHREQPGLDAIYGDLLIVDEDGEELTRQFMTTPSNFIQRYWSLFASNQSLFVSAATLDDIGALDEDLQLTMDAQLTWRLLEGAYHLERVPDVLGAFRIQADAKTFDDVKAEQQAELDRIYDHPWYEAYLPRPVLETLARGLKFTTLVRAGRWDALRYNFASLG